VRCVLQISRFFITFIIHQQKNNTPSLSKKDSVHSALREEGCILLRTSRSKTGLAAFIWSAVSACRTAAPSFC
jgi:hypothetical protein